MGVLISSVLWDAKAIEAEALKELAAEERLRAIAEAKLRIVAQRNARLQFPLKWIGWYRDGSH